MGLWEAEGHRNASLSHSQSLSGSLLPYFSSQPFTLFHTLAHMTMHTLLKSSSPLSLLSLITQYSHILCFSQSFDEYSTCIILFGQGSWVDVIQEGTDIWAVT